jgi:hypothetical protein
MSRYIYGKSKRNWNDPSSKYGLQPEKLDEDIAQNQKRYEEKQAKINEILNKLITDDPTRQEETFSMIVDWAREWRRNH